MGGGYEVEKLDLILQKLELLEELPKQFDEFGNRLGRLEQRFDNLDAKVDGLDTKVNKLDAKVSELDTKVNSLDEKVNSLDGKVDHLEIGQKELYQLVSAVRHRQELGDAKLESISMDVHKLHGELASLREETRLGFKGTDRRIRSIERDLDLALERLDALEGHSEDEPVRF